MSVFVCDRLTPELRTPIVFEVEARDMVQAARLAGEVAYAAAWVQGTYHPKHRDHRTPPVQWAVRVAEDALGMSVVDAMKAAIDAEDLEGVARGLELFVDSFGDLVLA